MAAVKVEHLEILKAEQMVVRTASGLVALSVVYSVYNLVVQ